MLRMTTSKDPSLLTDVDWDVSVKKKPTIWKTWVRCTLFLFLILTVFVLIALFMFGFIYRHDFLTFVKFTPALQPASEDFLKEHMHSGSLRMTTKLFSEINSNGNKVWSPLTVSLGLSLLLEAATGQTSDEIKHGMGWNSVDGTDIRNYVARIMKRFNNIDDLNSIIANRMFLHNSYYVASGYESILSEFYQTSVDRVDFTSVSALDGINRWGLEESRGQIKELIPPGTIDAATKMVLTSFLTFNGKWQHPFSPNRTQKADFTTENGKKRTVDMMYLTGRFMYGVFRAHGFIALELPYSVPNISMMILLPQRLGLSRMNDILEEQNGKMLIDIGEKMKRTQVDVCLPKFTIETGSPMERYLSSLGIKRLFGPYANLDMLSPNAEIYVQKIIHRVKIQVDESGTSGQASSLSLLEGRSTIPSFCADRPFLFYVEDKETHSILFWGSYNGPE